MEDNVISMLKPMFPNLSDNEVRTSVFHPKNRRGELSENTLFERCLDDLLQVGATRVQTDSTSSNGSGTITVSVIESHLASTYENVLTPSMKGADMMITETESPTENVMNSICMPALEENGGSHTAVPPLSEGETINSTESPRSPSLNRKRPVFGPDVFYGAETPTKLPKLSDSGHEQSNGDFVNYPKPDAAPKKPKDHTESCCSPNSLGNKTDIKTKETKPKDNQREILTQIYYPAKSTNSTLKEEMGKFERKETHNNSAAQEKRMWYAVCPACQKNSLTVEICSYCGCVLPKNVKLIDRNVQDNVALPNSASSTAVPERKPSAALSRPDTSPATSSNFSTPTKLLATPNKDDGFTDSDVTETSSEADISGLFKPSSPTDTGSLLSLTYSIHADPFDDRETFIHSPAYSPLSPYIDSPEQIEKPLEEMEAAVAMNVGNPIGGLQPLPSPVAQANLQEQNTIKIELEQPAVEPQPVDALPIAEEIIEPPVVIVDEGAAAPDPVNNMVDEVVSLFPDADPEYVRELITSTGNPYPVNVACNILLENPQYPRIKKGPDSAQGFTASGIDYYTDIGREVSLDYKAQCFELLKNDFKKMSVKDLRTISNHFNYHYAPVRKCIIAALEEAKHAFKTEEINSPLAIACPVVNIELPNTAVINVQLPEVEYRSNETGMSHKKAAHTVPCKPIKAPRQRRKIIGLCEQLKDEIGFIMNKSKEEKEVSLFPDADPEYVRELITSTGNPYPVNVTCNILLENPQYPHIKKKETNKGPDSAQGFTASGIDYYTDIGREVSLDYKAQCFELLKNDFKKMSVKDLRTISNHFNYHYAPVRKCIIAALEEANHAFKTEEINSPLAIACPVVNIELPNTAVINVQLPEVEYRSNETGMSRKKAAHTVPCKPIKAPRQRRKIIGLCEQLKDEIGFIMNKSKEEKEAKDLSLAMTLNEAEYEDEGQSIECECCFGTFPFEQMVQCYEGHLFCQECLKSYAREAVFGQGKVGLPCMADGCDTTYPKSQLEKALPKEIISKYEERAQEESLNLAGMEGLVRCPSCDFAALMDPDDKVFRCQNPDCMKQTCRYCKEDWKEHFGKPCREMEKKDETKIRVAFEEKMTEAKVRKCRQCKASFMKSDGCNKMTCRCGAKMCYICRKPNIDYNHFCGHPREPGHQCDKCNACSLWTNPEEDDERAVEEIRKEAAEERKRQGFTDDKLVGASPERIQKKKKRTGQAAAAANAANQNRPPPPPPQPAPVHRNDPLQVPGNLAPMLQPLLNANPPWQGGLPPLQWLAPMPPQGPPHYQQPQRHPNYRHQPY